MKKIIVLAAALAFAVAASAQIYVEGALGYNSNSVKPDGGDKLTVSTYSIAPSIGYYLNDKFDVGLGFGYAGSSSKPGADVKISGSDWGIAPFARYSFFRFGKFETLAKLAVGFGGGKVETTVSGTSETSGKYTTLGINLTPVLAYSLTDKIVLTTTLNFFNLGYNSTNYKDAKYKESSFGFGVNTFDAISVGGEGAVNGKVDGQGNFTGTQSMPGITVGFAYKF